MAVGVEGLRVRSGYEVLALQAQPVDLARNGIIDAAASLPPHWLLAMLLL